MHPRLVDWLLLILVLFETVSGLGTFLIGQPTGRWFFALHGGVGLALIFVLGLKIARVAARRGPAPRRRPPWLALGALAGVVCVLGTGIVWVSFQAPSGRFTGMMWHVAAGLALLPVLAGHAWLRRKPLSRRALLARRNVVAWAGMAFVGAGGYWLQHQAHGRWAWPGAQRRFTGSRAAAGPLPITQWMFDPIPVLEPDAWTLRIDGCVRAPLQLAWADLLRQPAAARRVTLDCTGGWFQENLWEGVPVSRLLHWAGADPAARYVSFRSHTGYRWSLSRAETQRALLAYRLDGAWLTPGHGAPLRLVAPGHRGFQWVKWVTALQVRQTPDFGQWGAIFASGLTDERPPA